jgi:CRP/FNR family transcriptional regulator, cyclic AMP receptor protein
MCRIGLAAAHRDLAGDGTPLHRLDANRWGAIANGRRARWRALKQSAGMKTTEPPVHAAIELPVTVPHGDPNPVPIAELATLSFFDGLGPARLAQLTPHTKTSYFGPGEPILTEGELANRFYVIVSGRVAIEHKIDGDVVRVQEIGPGEAVGYSWLFTPDKLHFTARAIEPVKAIFFYGTLLREDCELEPSLGYELLIRGGQVMVKRMEAVIALLKEKHAKPQADQSIGRK